MLPTLDATCGPPIRRCARWEPARERATAQPGRKARAAALTPATPVRRALMLREPRGRGVRAGALRGAGPGHPRPGLRAHFDAAAREETDHLAWTRERLDELERAALATEPAVVTPGRSALAWPQAHGATTA